MVDEIQNDICENVSKLKWIQKLFQTRDALKLKKNYLHGVRNRIEQVISIRQITPIQYNDI